MTTLDEFMAAKSNAYMAVVDSWRPRTAALKANYDDYKRWATTPNGTYWSGKTAAAAQEAAADDCKGTDNADDTVEDVVKLATATITYEVLPPLTSGQNLVTNALREGVTVSQDFTMTYHPAEGESEKSVARNKQIVADAERELREYVAKWEKATQELKTQADSARENMLSRINPKAALVDGRKVLREATSGQPAAETIDYKQQYPKVTDPASTTPAAATGGPETINYKELYPKTASVDGHQLGSIGAMPGVGDIDKTKPAKLAPTLADRDVPAFAQATRERLQHEGVPANQIEQRVNEAVQRAQAPRFAPDADPMRTPGQVPLHNSPGDQFNDIVGRANDEATKTIDGQIEQAKILTGQAGPGAPGVAEAWKQVGLGAAQQVHELTSDPLAAPKMGIEQAKDFYNHPGEFIGKNLIHGTEALAGGAVGGEAAAGARGLLGDLTGTEGRVITHGLEDGGSHHSVDHPAPAGDHGGGLGGNVGGSDNLPHIEIKMKDGWSEFQQTQMEQKMQQFNAAVGDNGFSQTPPVPRDPAVRQLFLDTLGMDRVPPGVHVDHTRDLQAGGTDSIDNMGLLDGSVNTSFGSQLNARMNEHPPGTVFGGVRPPDP